MKNKLAQLYVLAGKIDRRYVQLAYYAFVLGLAIIQAPVDGGGGPH